MIRGLSLVWERGRVGEQVFKCLGGRGGRSSEVEGVYEDETEDEDEDES